MFNRVFFLFIFVMYFSFSSVSEAAESEVPPVATPTESSKGRKIEEVMANTSNQFIYAFFGKDLLLYYLNDVGDIEAVEKSNDSELGSLSSPFNTVTGKLFMAGLTLVYFLTLGYFVYRVACIALEVLWLGQQDGGFNMDARERRGLVLKVFIIGSLVIVPIPLKSDLVNDSFYTNLGTVLLFDLMGRSHSKSDEALIDVVDSQRQSLKTLALPAAESKMNEMQALNSFYTCARLQHNRSNKGGYIQTFDLFVKDGDTLSGSAKVGDCLIRVELGVDNKSDLKIKQIKMSTSNLLLDENLFAKAQKDVFKSLLEDLFSNAKRYSKELAKDDFSSSWDDGAFSFKNQTSLELSVPELKKWASRCEALDSWESPAGNLISRRDRYYYHHLISRCQSKLVAQKLVYPESYEAVSNLIGNNTRIQKELALCVDSASMNKVLGESRFVAQYGIGSSDSGNIEKIALDTCISNMCSSSALNSGSLYACTNALDLYQTRLRDVRIQERGVMMLGFYMFDLFLHQEPSSAAKHVFNKFSISFDPMGELKKEDLQEDLPFMSFDFPVPENYQHVTKKNEIIGNLTKEFSRTSLPTIYAPQISGSFISEMIGTNRLNSCVRNPLQIHGGFVCGNLPQEFSRFGLTLMKNVITIKTLITVGQSFGRMRRGNSSDSGVFTSSNGGFAETAMRQMTLAAVKLISSDNEYFGKMYDNIAGFHYNATDEFGYLNSVKVDQLMNNSLMTVIVYLSVQNDSSSLISVIDSLLFFGIIISIVFAFAIPLFPMMIVLGALIKFSYILISTVILHGFKIVDAATDRDADFLSEDLDKVFADWLALGLKLPLTLIGAFLAWLMSNVIISHVLTHMDISVSTNDGTQGIFDMIIMLIVAFSVVFIVYNMIMTLIESFYDFTIEWVLGTMHSSPYSDNTKAIGWKNSKEVLHLLGR